MRFRILFAFLIFACSTARGQIQLDLKFKRVQYVAYEPLIATVQITNLAGRDIELHDEEDQRWFGFEVKTNDERFLPVNNHAPEPPLKIEAGKTVTRKIDLTPQFPVHELGPYHVRANIFFADLHKFFYSPGKVVHVVNARPIWQRTVGIPEGMQNAGEPRTYSLLTNRFPDHTSLYVRVEDKDTGVVYSTYSLGRAIAFDEPQAELDQQNLLHVLHCAAPRSWSYSQIGPNGELLAHKIFLETKSRPHLRRAENGAVVVKGGMLDAPVQSSHNSAAKLSARPPSIPSDD
ncbi:MAG: hypothetical protein M3119_01245 [Verrucomicrobiota bacterium]|nr:hypothetical protein [Verrucomicrobiota bacterium]MDQ6938763.1 hypothetical protein [Verrucomicrobiota bacterium]